jgi:hypothetical protein
MTDDIGNKTFANEGTDFFENSLTDLFSLTRLGWQAGRRFALQHRVGPKKYSAEWGLNAKAKALKCAMSELLMRMEARTTCSSETSG